MDTKVIVITVGFLWVRWAADVLNKQSAALTDIPVKLVSLRVCLMRQAVLLLP